MEDDNLNNKRLLDNVDDDSLFKEVLKPKTPWYKHWWVYVYMGVFVVSLIVLANFAPTTDSILNKLDFNKLSDTAEQANFRSDQSVLPGADLAALAELSPLEATLRRAEDDPAWGNPEAPIVIVEFADFQCPYCQESFGIIKQILNSYSNDIYFIYRDFPIVELHPDAMGAALAGQCAWEQDLFWPLHDLMFSYQENLSRQSVLALAAQAGIDMDQFTVCLDSKKYASEVLEDFSVGLELGVAGTPTFFINGYSVSGVVPQAKWEELIALIKLVNKSN